MNLHTIWRGTTHRYLLAVLLAAMMMPLLLPATPAHAIVGFVINTAADTDDADPGNGVCADAAGNCSLRAAIQETNALPGVNTLNVPANTYLLAKQLVVEDDLFVYGAGKGQTVLDGNNVTEVLKIRTAELLVCDAGDDSVASYRLNGQANPDFLASGKGGLDAPTSIAIGPVNQNDVFVMAANSGIHRFSATGEDKRLFLKPENAGHATDGVFGHEDGAWPYLYTTDYTYPNSRIVVTHHEAAVGGTFIKSGTGGLDTPDSLAFHKDDLYVSNVGTNDILRYNGKTGTFVEVFADNLNLPRDLVFHGGKLYVANEGGDNVLRYDASTGALEAAFVGAGSGGLDGPTDLAFGPDGALYVISSNNKRILRYDGNTGAFDGVFVQGGTRFLDNPICLEWRKQEGAGPTVNITGVTIRNGETLQSTGPTAGLDIDQGAFVGLSNSAVIDNDSRTRGGGIRNYGTLALNSVEVRDNTLPEGGGGMMSTGGGIFNEGALTIKNSLIADNFATRGGGISNEGTLNISNSTITGNRTAGAGGGIRNIGTLNINASTISENYANEAVYEYWKETKRFGGGIANLEGGHVNMANTIVAENFDRRTKGEADYSPDCYSPEADSFTSYRDNLVGILTDNCLLSDSVYGDTRFDKVGTPDVRLDPGLGWLGYYGGQVLVYELLNTSPALDGDKQVIGGSFFDCPTWDQRGMARPQGSRCDIGAFELVQGVGSSAPNPSITVQPQPKQAEPTAEAAGVSLRP